MSKALELSQLANDVTYNEATDTLSFGQANLTIGSDALLAYNDFSGDLTVDSAGVVTFATVNSNTGSFGSSTAIPVITVNAKGLITAVSTSTISTDLDIAGDTGTDTVTLGTDTLTVAGGVGLTSTVTNNNISIALDNTAVTAGSYGSGSAIPVLTIDAQGRITGATTASVNIVTTTDISGDSGTDTITLGTDVLNFAGDTGITTTVTNNQVSIDLDDTAVTPASYGSATAIPVITIDQQGRITGATTASISTDLSTAGDSGTGTVALSSQSLTISGTANEIETVASAQSITIGLPDNVTIGNNLIVDGDLTVNGSTVTVGATNLSVADSYIYLNDGDAIGPAGTTFTGTGVDDADFYGYFKGTATTSYYVRIDATGTPDTFEWSKDNFVTTEATGVAIDGTEQLLDDGIKIKFDTTTGHTLGDVWSGSASPASLDTGWWSNRNTGATGVGYTHLGMFFDVSDEKFKFVQEYDPEPTGSINTGDASFNLGTLVATTFEGNVTGQVSDISNHNTDALSEGATNLYFTDARADARIALQTGANLDLSSKSTTDLSEGTNLYYTDARVDAHLNQTNPTAGYVLSWNGSDYAWIDNTGYTSFATDFDTRLATKTTTDLTEGTNLYYTNARADARIALQVGANLDLSSKDTDDLSEGASNLYFTDARVQATSITAGSLRGTVNNATVQYATTYSGTPVQGSFFFDSLNQKLKVYTGSAFVDAVPAGSGGGGGAVTDANATFRKYTYTTSSSTNTLSGKDDIVVIAGNFVVGYLYEIITVGTTDFTLIGASANTPGVQFTATDIGTGSGTASGVLNYDTSGIENIEVYVNGIKQVEGSSYDYVATTGTSVSFTSNLQIGDVADIQVYELLTQDAYYLKTETYTQAETNSQISTAVSAYLPLTGGTVTGVIEVDTARPQIFLYENDRTGNNTRLETSFDNFNIAQVDDTNSNPVNRMQVEMDTGDIRFFEATGTTARFFWDASTEMLGIGTATPNNPLHIQNSNNTLARFESTTTTSKIALQDSTDTAYISKTASHLALGFNSTHNDQTLFITSAGKVNVGLDGGTTASLDAMLTVLDEFRVVTQVSVPNNTTGGKISLGATGLTNQAAQAEIAVHRGSNSLTGDLSFATGNGTAITEKMRILDNGNVGIGTDNPGRQLTLSNGGAALLSLVSTGDDNCQILFGDSASDTVGKVLYRHADDRLSLQAGGTEIVHVLSSGVGIGTNTPSYPLDIITDAGDAEFRLRTLGTDAADHTIMRFQIGGTTGSNYIYFGDSGDSNAGQIRYNHGNDELTINVAATEVFAINVDGGGAVEYVMGDNSVGVISSSTRFTLLNDNAPTGRTMDMYRASTTDSNHIQNWYSDVGGVKTLVAAVEANGDFNSATNSYAGISDARLKENIVDAASQLDDIKAVQVRNFNFINNPEVTMLGVVAQELEASGITGLVKTANDEDTGKEIKSVKYSVLYMKAIKALQETIAKVEALETENTAIKARLDALENNG